MTHPDIEKTWRVFNEARSKAIAQYWGQHYGGKQTEADYLGDLAGIRAVLKFALSIEPSEGMANAWAKLAVDRIKRRMADDNDCPGPTEGAKESFKAMQAQARKERGLDDA